MKAHARSILGTDQLTVPEIEAILKLARRMDPKRPPQLLRGTDELERDRPQLAAALLGNDENIAHAAPPAAARMISMTRFAAASAAIPDPCIVFSFVVKAPKASPYS